MLDPQLAWQLLYCLPIVLMAVLHLALGCGKQRSTDSIVAHTENCEPVSLRSKMAPASGSGSDPHLDVYDEKGEKVTPSSGQESKRANDGGDGKKKGGGGGKQDNKRKGGFGFAGIKKGAMPKKPDDENKTTGTPIGSGISGSKLPAEPHKTIHSLHSRFAKEEQVLLKSRQNRKKAPPKEKRSKKMKRKRRSKKKTYSDDSSEDEGGRKYSDRRLGDSGDDMKTTKAFNGELSMMEYCRSSESDSLSSASSSVAPLADVPLQDDPSIEVPPPPPPPPRATESDHEAQREESDGRHSGDEGYDAEDGALRARRRIQDAERRRRRRRLTNCRDAVVRSHSSGGSDDDHRGMGMMAIDRHEDLVVVENDRDVGVTYDDQLFEGGRMVYLYSQWYEVLCVGSFDCLQLPGAEGCTFPTHYDASYRLNSAVLHWKRHHRMNCRGIKFKNTGILYYCTVHKDRPLCSYQHENSYGQCNPLCRMVVIIDRDKYDREMGKLSTPEADAGPSNVAGRTSSSNRTVENEVLPKAEQIQPKREKGEKMDHTENITSDFGGEQEVQIKSPSVKETDPVPPARDDDNVPFDP